MNLNKIEINKDNVQTPIKSDLIEKKVKFSKKKDIIEYNNNLDAVSNISEKIRNKND